MAYKKKEEPGFLILYDFLPNFKKMTFEQVGRFVMAMGDYATSCGAIVPDFSESERMDTLWMTAQPFLDRNKEEYQRKSKGNSYSGWCSSLAAAGKDYLKIPKDDYIQARELYENYLDTLPTGAEPQLFNDWLYGKRHRDENKEPITWTQEDYTQGL